MPAADEYIGAFAGQREGDGSADATPTASDNCCLIFEFHSHCPTRMSDKLSSSSLVSGVLLCRGVPPWAPLLECQIGKNGAPTEGRPIKLGHRYSQRNASMGFRRAAFQAGHRPNTMPTAAEIPTPIPMAHRGT